MTAAPLADVRRKGIVYGFNILDPDTMQVRGDYVGQTVQRLEARERQHRGDDWDTDASEQPWSDLIVGKPFVVEEGWWTPAELDEREIFHIHRLRPRYNYKHNLDNPERIPIPVARRQREERDRAAGRVSPTWDKPAVPRRPAPAVQRPQRPVKSRPWSKRRRWTVTLAAMWAGLTVAGWIVAAQSVGVLAGAGYGAGGSGAVTAVAGIWWASMTRKQRQRVVLAALLVAVLAAAGIGMWLASGRPSPPDVRLPTTTPAAR